MGCDMIVARGTATGTGQTLFAANCHRPRGECQTVGLVPGKNFALGEMIQTRSLQLPQPRRTQAVLAVQPRGSWGYLHGLNERRVAVGVSDWQSCLAGEGDRRGLLGPELVRLVLERARSARH